MTLLGREQTESWDDALGEENDKQYQNNNVM